MLIPRRPEAKDERHKFHIPLRARGASLVAQLVKNPPTMRETWVQSLGWEDPLEKVMATPSSILAWRIPWTLCVCVCVCVYIHICTYMFTVHFTDEKNA